MTSINVQLIERDGKHHVGVTMDGETTRYGPFATTDEAEIMAARVATQAANSKTQDNVGLEAKAGVVGRVCPPGGKEGVPEDTWKTTQEIQQARALRYAG